MIKNLEMLGAAFTLQTNLPASHPAGSPTTSNCSQHRLEETPATALTGRYLPLESCQQQMQLSAMNQPPLTSTRPKSSNRSITN